MFYICPGAIGFFASAGRAQLWVEAAKGEQLHLPLTPDAPPPVHTLEGLLIFAKQVFVTLRRHFKIESSRFTPAGNLVLHSSLCSAALFSAVCQLWQLWEANITALAGSDTSAKQTCPNLSSSSCQQPSCRPADCPQPQIPSRALQQQQQQSEAAGKVGSALQEEGSGGIESVGR